MIGSLIDTAMDRTVVPGYSKFGLAVRRRLPGWPEDPPRMEGAVVLVTGASSGLGYETARRTAELGASVRVLTRDAERSERLATELVAETAGDVVGVSCDVSSLDSLHEFCERFTAEEKRLDVLVNNAGVMPAERTLSDDGVELTFATHVLGPFVLIDSLKGLLESSAPARVVNVVSGGLYAQKLDIDDLQAEEGSYRKAAVYAKTKRAELLMGDEWARRLRGSGVVVHAMHPGWTDTPGVQDSMPGFSKVTKPIIRNLEEGADTIVWLAGAPEALESSGEFWCDRKPRPEHRVPFTHESADDRRRLWEERVALAGSVS